MKSLFALSLLGVLVATACTTKPKANEGEYDPEAVRGVIRSHMGEIKLCYGATLERNPNVEGKLVLNFNIGHDGYITNVDPVQESTNLKDDRFMNCIRDAIATWQFPVPPEGVVAEVKYPFVFGKTPTQPNTIQEPEE